MVYSSTDFYNDVFREIKKKKNSNPTDEECKAVAHHMEYNIRANRKFANNGHLTIDTEDLRKHIVSQIKNNLHGNDIPRYLTQYRQYKTYQKNWKLTPQEEKDLQDIALKKKKVSDYSNKDYLKNIYIKYFNQKLMPEIKKISWQEKNHLKYHGLWHTEQVALFAIDIAVAENTNPLPVLLSAALHDCARKNDYNDPDHAKNCEPIARDFLTNRYKDKNLISPQEQEAVIHAVTHHNAPSKFKNNIVLNCLQDADSMRLWWERGQKYQANTTRGRELTAYETAPWKQIKYMANMLEKMRATQRVFTMQNMRNYRSI